MKLIFTIKRILTSEHYLKGDGPFAINTKPTLKNEYILDRFADAAQVKRFEKHYSSWKPITIKKL